MAVIFAPERPTLAGRIGKGFAQGLAEQVPKEIERGRLSKGLQQFEKDSANLSPMQQLSRLASIPGALEHPQLIESFGNLARQQAKSQALIQKGKGQNEAPVNPFKKEKPASIESGKDIAPSITTRTPLEATLKPYQPKSLTQLQDRAGELLETNPGFYANSPDPAGAALNDAQREDQQEQARNQALQGQRANEHAVQQVIQNSLAKQNELLGAHVPGTVYSEIENQAVKAVKSIEDGGEGLTEQQAIKKYGKDLDKISRDYKAIETVGTMGILTKSPEGNRQSLQSIRNGFKERDDLENFADTMISKNSLSPPKAYYLAYPVSENKELNNYISKIPELKNEGKVNYTKGYPEVSRKLSPEDIVKKTNKISPEIADLMGTEASPLSIAVELESRGYDPYTWMDYVDKNRKRLNLSERQGRELDKPRNFTPTWNDMWMFTFSGLDKLVEQ